MPRISCNICTLPERACLCAALPKQAIDNAFPLYILQHWQERTHALNTARIAVLGLKRCQLFPVADIPAEEVLPLALQSQLNDALLIYPGAESTNVAELRGENVAARPLVLLDASWRKSKRMLLSSTWLQNLPRISFDVAQPSRYRIRKAPAPNYSSTLEALCTVLGSLENNPEKYAPLLAAMDVMIDRQIEQMGEATFLRNYLRQRDNC